MFLILFLLMSKTIHQFFLEHGLFSNNVKIKWKIIGEEDTDSKKEKGK